MRVKPGWKMRIGWKDVMDPDRLAIVDAHQHFWDLSLGKHPWLRDEPPPPFRYGDTRPLRRSYLPADYRADAGAYRVVGSVYVETEWDPTDPVGETRWVQDLAAREGLPSAVVAQAWLDRDDVEDVLARQAACPLVRGIRHKPARRRPRTRSCRAPRGRWATPGGAPGSRGSRATGCRSTSRRPGGTFRRRRRSPVTSPTRRSS